MVLRTRELVIIDDDDEDILVLQESLANTGLDFHLTIIHKGCEAVRYFEQLSHNSLEPNPDLIILDLQLPDLNGIDLLRTIRNDPALIRIPIIAYTGLDDGKHIASCYKAGINCCIKKPTTIQDATNLANSINDFWFKTLRLPSDYQQSHSTHNGTSEQNVGLLPKTMPRGVVN